MAEAKKAESKADSKLLAAAKEKAPHLTQEFADKHGLTDDDLGQIARGEVSPPPDPAPSADLHRTPGGWQSTPAGVKPEDVGKDAISR